MAGQSFSESKEFTHATTLLLKKWPAVRHSALLRDLSYQKGEVAYLSVTCNSLSYHIKLSGIANAIALPFSVNQATGYFKLEITSDDGYAELVPVSSKSYCMGTKKKRQHHQKAPLQLSL